MANSNKKDNSNKKNKRDNSLLVKKYKNEPKVQVIGSKLYKKHLGSVYTFTFNDFPVSIKFDGTAQEFPQTIAGVINRKLNEISESNSAKEVNKELYT
jgi:hypothetical protein